MKAADDVPFPREVGGFVLEEELVSSRLSRVYRASRNHRNLALEVFEPEAQADRAILERFVKGSPNRIRHPNLMPIESIGEFDDKLFCSMKFLRGDSLRRIIDELLEGVSDQPSLHPLAMGAEGSRRPDYNRRAMQLIAEVADGLEKAHRGGICHLHLQPRLLIFSPAGRLIITDFNGSGDPSSVETGTGPETETETSDSLPYRSPEQILGDEASAAADIYSLGAILYEIITLTPPFQFTDSTDLREAIAEGRLSRPREVRRDVPRRLEHCILRAMALEPSDRYSSAADFATDLRAVQGGKAPKNYVAEPRKKTAPNADAPFAADEIERLKEELQKIKSEENRLRAKNERLLAEEKRIESRRLEMDRGKAELDEQHRDIELRESGQEFRATSLAREREQIDAKGQEQKQLLSRWCGEREELHGDLKELRGERDRLRGDLEGLRGDLEELGGERDGLGDEREELRGELSKLRDERDGLGSDLKRLTGELTELRASYEQLRTTEGDLIAANRDIEQQLADQLSKPRFSRRVVMTSLAVLTILLGSLGFSISSLRYEGDKQETYDTALALLSHREYSRAAIEASRLMEMEPESSGAVYLLETVHRNAALEKQKLHLAAALRAMRDDEPENLKEALANAASLAGTEDAELNRLVNEIREWSMRDRLAESIDRSPPELRAGALASLSAALLQGSRPASAAILARPYLQDSDVSVQKAAFKVFSTLPTSSPLLDSLDLQSGTPVRMDSDAFHLLQSSLLRIGDADASRFARNWSLDQMKALDTSREDVEVAGHLIITPSASSRTVINARHTRAWMRWAVLEKPDELLTQFPLIATRPELIGETLSVLPELARNTKSPETRRRAADWAEAIARNNYIEHAQAAVASLSAMQADRQLERIATSPLPAEIRKASLLARTKADSDASTFLVDIALDDPDAELRYIAFDYLLERDSGPTSGMKQVIVRSLDDEQLRKQALDWISRQEVPQRVVLANELLNHSHPDVRKLAGEILRRDSGDTSLRSVYLGLFNSSSDRRAMSIAILEARGELKGVEAEIVGSVERAGSAYLDLLRVSSSSARASLLELREGGLRIQAASLPLLDHLVDRSEDIYSTWTHPLDRLRKRWREAFSGLFLKLLPNRGQSRSSSSQP